jgi:hypothetical protein
MSAGKAFCSLPSDGNAGTVEMTEELQGRDFAASNLVTVPGSQCLLDHLQCKTLQGEAGAITAPALLGSEALMPCLQIGWP